MRSQEREYSIRSAWPQPDAWRSVPSALPLGAEAMIPYYSWNGDEMSAHHHCE